MWCTGEVLRNRIGPLLAVVVLALVGACGSDGTSASSPEGSASTDEATVQDDGPLVRLTKVVYNGKPQYEFAYGPAGEPTSYQVFHPVTGELSNTFTVDEVDGDRVVAETMTRRDGQTSTAHLEYDGEGRLVSVTRHTDAGAEKTTYTWTDGQVTMKGSTTQIVYELDGAGNITKSTTTSNGRTYTSTYSAYDDAPNPFTLTGGMAAQIWSLNNHTASVVDAGCEYTVDLTYDEGGRVVASHSEGCAELRGTPIVHDYVYEYAGF